MSADAFDSVADRNSELEYMIDDPPLARITSLDRE